MSIQHDHEVDANMPRSWKFPSKQSSHQSCALFIATGASFPPSVIPLVHLVLYIQRKLPLVQRPNQLPYCSLYWFTLFPTSYHNYAAILVLLLIRACFVYVLAVDTLSYTLISYTCLQWRFEACSYLPLLLYLILWYLCVIAKFDCTLYMSLHNNAHSIYIVMGG